MKNKSAVGTHRHLVSLQRPVTFDDAGNPLTFADLEPPTWHCSIEPATARDLERVTSGTVLASASHVLKGSYHAGITTQTHVTFNGRLFYVAGVANPEERNIETIAIASEVVT